MRYIKYFFQFLIVIIFFCFFKILGPSLSSRLSGKIFEIIGPYFRSKEIIYSNILKAFPKIETKHMDKIANLMWNNYGRVFSEYVFLKEFRSGKLKSRIEVEGQETLDKILKSEQQVIFISGHFSNFELMAMHLEESGIKLAAIFRPLNNIHLHY